MTVMDSPAASNDFGKYIWAVASYGDSKTAKFVSPNPVQATRTNENAVPAFASTSLTRGVAEHSGVMNIGAPVRASDADNDILTYRLSVGDDQGLFTIDPATGQLKTMRAGLDYEQDEQHGSHEYVVMVTATDSSGEGSEPEATVIITVTNVNEEPEFTVGTNGVADRPPRGQRCPHHRHLHGDRPGGWHGYPVADGERCGQVRVERP